MGENVEYRVRPVTRYVVTKYEQHGTNASVETVGEFPNESMADRVRLSMQIANMDFNAEPVIQQMTKAEALAYIAELQAIANDETMPFGAVKKARYLVGMDNGLGMHALFLSVLDQINSLADGETIPMRIA